MAQLVERVAAARGGGACPLRTGQLGAGAMAGARPIHHLCALMDERCTCKRPERERPHRVASTRASPGFAQGLGLAWCSGKIGVREGAVCVMTLGAARSWA